MHSEPDKKKALKKLRQDRKQSIKNATAAIKAQGKTIKAIKARLSQSAATVPEIADQTGISTEEVLWFIATMKKYGQVVEDSKDGGYYRYAAARPDAQAEKEGGHP